MMEEVIHLDDDTVFRTPFDDLLLLTERVELDLVHGWQLESRISNLL